MQSLVNQNIPRVAVMIPAYKSEATLAETLHSLLESQIDGAIEKVLLVENGASPETVAIARRVWTSATPLDILTIPVNNGLWPAKNLAFEKLAEFDWVVMLHADDVLKPCWLELYLDAMRAADDRVASICSSYDNWFFESGEIEPGEDAVGEPPRKIEGTPGSIADGLNRGCWWHISGAAVRPAAFRDIGAFDERYPYSGDLEWMLRCFSRGYSIVYIPRTTMLYRRHKGAATNTAFDRGWDIKEYRIFLNHYHEAGELPRSLYDKLMRQQSLLALRRIAVRLLRGDWKAAGAHLALLMR